MSLLIQIESFPFFLICSLFLVLLCQCLLYQSQEKELACSIVSTLVWLQRRKYTSFIMWPKSQTTFPSNQGLWSKILFFVVLLKKNSHYKTLCFTLLKGMEQLSKWLPLVNVDWAEGMKPAPQVFWCCKRLKLDDRFIKNVLRRWHSSLNLLTSRTILSWLQKGPD